MSVVANVAINIDAKNAASVLDEIKRKVEAMNGAFDKVPGAKPKIDGLAGDLVGLASKFVSVAAAAETLRRSINASFERSQAETRLKALTSQYGETSEAMKLASKASDTFGLTQTEATKAIADVYGRLRPLGFSLQEVSDVYDGFNVLSKQAALSSQEAAGVFTQLSQSLGSGTLRGDEFNRMAESMPAILGVVAKELGVSQGALRGMAADGKITGAVVVKALQGVAAEAGDLKKFLDPSQKAMNELRKNTEEAMVQLGNLLAPAAINALTALAKGFEFAAKNMKQIVQTATFFGTFAAVLWGIQKATAAWAAAQKAAGVATAFLQALINPASLANTAIALGVATTATIALGAAMGDGAKEAAKIDPAAQAAAKATTAAAEEAKKAKEAYAAAQVKAKELAITLQTEVVNAAKTASAEFEQQMSRMSGISSIVDAQITGELKLNELRKIGLEQQFEAAKTSKDRARIAIEITKNEIKAAQLVYQQTIARLKIESAMLQMKQQQAVLKGYEILAEGKLQILKAKDAGERAQKIADLNAALGAQNQVIKATAAESAAQDVLNKYIAKTAQDQYKVSVATAANALQQRLVGQNIGYSVGEARKLANGIYTASTNTETMGRVSNELQIKMDRAAKALDAQTQAGIQNAYQFKAVADQGGTSQDQWREKVLAGIGAQQQVATATQQTTQTITAANNIRALSTTQTDQQIVQSAVVKDQQIVQSAANKDQEIVQSSNKSSNLIQKAFENIYGFAKFSLDNVFGLMKWQFQAMVAIADTLLVTPIVRAFKALFNFLGDIFNKIGDAFNKNVATPIGKAMESAVNKVQDTWRPIAQWFTKNVTDPISKVWKNVTEFIPKAIKGSIDFVVNTWNGAINSIKQSVRGVLQYLANIINAVGDRVNILIDAFNRLPRIGPGIPRVGRISVPAFAEGGVVSGPTLALVGEKETEYIIPASKMAGAVANYMAGHRGSSVVPAFATGGVVVGQQSQADITDKFIQAKYDQANKMLRENGFPEMKRLINATVSDANQALAQAYYMVVAKQDNLAKRAHVAAQSFKTLFDVMNYGMAKPAKSSSGTSQYQPSFSPQPISTQPTSAEPITINITTGPILEFDGKKYVTLEDMEKGLRQVADSVVAGLRTPAGRYTIGVR